MRNKIVGFLCFSHPHKLRLEVDLDGEKKWYICGYVGGEVWIL